MYIYIYVYSHTRYGIYNKIGQEFRCQAVSVSSGVSWKPLADLGFPVSLARRRLAQGWSTPKQTSQEGFQPKMSEMW